MEVTDLTLNLLETITNQFSEEHKIGKGGYGEVYRAELNGYEIAVKKLYLINGLDDKSFTNEFRQLMKVQHENIIRLIGYCYEIKHKHTEHDGQLVFSQVIDRALCFEYMPEGSLANHISDDSCIHDWATTYKIIKGTCEGLHYLHKGRGDGDYIYHLDLKPDNILLAGRKGYGDYCDSRSSPRQAFIERVQEYWKRRMRKRRMRSAANYAWDEIDLWGVKICIELAMSCVEKERKNRPSTKAIIDELHKLDAQMEKMSKRDTRPLTGQRNSDSRDITLDPSLELRFPFKPNMDMFCCLALTNEVDSFIAFNIKTNKNKYCTRPSKGIIQPFSKSCITVTLLAQEKAPLNMECLDNFIVQSTRVSEDFTSQEITQDFFKRATAVDEVILPIAYVALE